MNTNQIIAQTILEQLGGNRFVVMTGAKNFFAIEKGLQFKLPNDKDYVRDAINCVKITLTPADEYHIEFGRVWGTKYTPVKTTDGIYCDQLREIFTRYTGLYTSFDG